jgi:hypothetical protein
MFASISVIRLSAITGAVAMLAGCGGAGAPTTVPNGAATSAVTRLASPDNCRHTGDVSATPCYVKLTVDQPMETISVTGPSGSTISAKSASCTDRGKATVEGSGSSWEVSAGASAGRCIVRFVATSEEGQQLGTVDVRIFNTV